MKGGKGEKGKRIWWKNIHPPQYLMNNMKATLENL